MNSGRLTRPRPFATVMGQGGRLKLHAETTSRGSEPVDGPTRSQKIELEGAKSAETLEGREGVKALAQAEGIEAVEARRSRRLKGPLGRQPASGGRSERCRRQAGSRRGASSAAPSGFLRSARRLRDWRPGAPAPRFRSGRRQPSRRHPALSRGTRARRACPPLPAGLRTRNRSPAVRTANAVRVCLCRDRRTERR